jgi:hypothetical protein
MNLYAYVQGNPVSRRDPLGLCPTGIDPITGGLTQSAQNALDAWNDALSKIADDIADGNLAQAQLDKETANYQAANYLNQIGQGPNPGKEPFVPQLAILAPPSISIPEPQHINF